MKFKHLLTKTLLVAVGLLGGVNLAWGAAPVSGSDYLIKNVQTGYYLVGGMDWGTHACLHKMPQWFTFTLNDGAYTLDSHQYNSSNDHFLNTELYVDKATENWTVTETATAGVFTISNGGKYLAGNGVDAAITTTTDGTAAAAQWQLISYSDFVSSLNGATAASGIDATPFIKDPELKRNGNFTTYTGRPWTITAYNGTGDPSNFSQGQDGNNASCAESYQSTNGFKVAQTLTGLKPGQYKLTAQAFYRQDGSDTENLPYLFVGDEKSYFPVRAGTEDNMPDAYASFLAGTYPVDPITFIVYSEADNITIGYANANAKMWNIFGQTQLTYYGTCVGSDAIAFTNGGTMTADQWYYFDATVAGTYEFSASSDLSAISYTTDGTQATTSVTGSTLTASSALSATRYYFKSSSAQTLTVDVPTGARIVNADIDFSNTIVESSVAGGVNSIALSNVAATNNSGTGYALGYNTNLTDVLRVGNGTGTVAIPTAQLAGSRDEVVITFDYYFGKLGGGYSGFKLLDASSNVIGQLYCDWYNGKWYSDDAATYNSFGFDVSKITALGASGTNNDAICVATNRTTFEIHLNYSTRTMYAKQYTNGTLKQTTDMVSLGSSNPLSSFVVNSNYSNDGRRCWFDNLQIYTIKGDYSVSEVGYTVVFVDGDGTKVKVDDTSRESVAGTDVSSLATSADKTTFYNDGDIENNNTEEFVGATNKYVYKSVSAVNSSYEPIDELEEGAVVTIVYDKYNKYDYAVKQKLGDAEATNRATGTLWGDQTYTYYFPKGIKNGSDYYFTEANGSSPYFRGTLTAAVPTVTINYTLDPTVIFYSEGEDLDSKTGTYTHFASDMANGSSGLLNDAAGNLITSLGAGIYTITARTIGRGDDTHKIYFYKSAVDDANKLLTCKPSYSGYTETSDAFELTATTDILVKGAQGGGANGNGLDYVIIKQYPSTVSKSITSAGWATYCSPYALDLANATGLDEAYIVTGGENSVLTKTSVKSGTVPANTGLLLKGSEGTATIPVVGSSATSVTANILEGVTVDTPIAAEAGWVLMASPSLGFYQNEAAFTVGANTAYIPVAKLAVPGSGARAFFSLVDETNGINAVANDVMNGKYYNLSGQRVAAPQKGLYIVNGKKVVVK